MASESCLAVCAPTECVLAAADEMVSEAVSDADTSYNTTASCSTSLVGDSTTRNQRRGASQRKMAAEVQDLKRQMELMKLEMQQSVAEKLALQREVEDLNEKRAEDALRNLVVLGKVKAERRARGVVSNSSGDEDFVACGPDPQESSQEGSSENLQAGENEEEEVVPLVSGTDSSSQSVADSEDNYCVALLQIQIEAVQTLFGLVPFQKAARPTTVENLIGLLRRAGEACEAFVVDFDEQAILAWTKVLQRALGKAVKETFESIDNVILRKTAEMTKCGLQVERYNHVIWKALPWEDRNFLLSHRQNVNDESESDNEDDVSLTSSVEKYC